MKLKKILILLFVFNINSIFFAQGSALSFSGNSYIEVANHPNLQLTDNVTFEAWVYLDNNVNNAILDKGNYNHLFMTHPNGQPALGLYSRSFGWIYSDGVVPTNEWVHIAVSFKTGTNGVNFYLNGCLLSSHSTNTPLASDAGPLNIARQDPLGCRCNLFTGDMDNLHIWNKALSQAEIAESMENNNLINPSLVANFTFDENSGTTVSSAIGGYVGNMVGTSSWVQGATVFPASSCPTLQTLTILGGNGATGDVDPYIEASLDNGATWQPAYLGMGMHSNGYQQQHPWGLVSGTTNWINFDPNLFVGLNTTTDYRIRFYIPEEFSNPKMTFTIKADNYAWLSLNGTELAYIVGQASNAPDLSIDQDLVSGLNELTVRLKDVGGWVGLNYRIDITMLANEAPTFEPSQFVNADPIAAAGEDQTFDCTPSTGVEVQLDGSGSTDEDGDELSFIWSNGATTAAQTLTLAPGTHTLTLTVEDGNGGISSDDVIVTINADTEAPVISSTTELLTLWSPNHKYETISLSDFGLSVSDNCAEVSDAALVITKVTSDEDENSKGKGDGNTNNDIVIANDFKSVELRKERNGSGNGRVYTIFVSIGDGNGNVGNTSLQVQVPKSQKSTSIDDGTAYEVLGGSINPGAAANGNQLSLNKNSIQENNLINNVAPDDFSLGQNYPNPFNPTTTISVSIPDAGYYTLNVYNLLGQEVAVLVKGELSSGSYRYNFDASNLSSGVYIYSLRGNNVNISKKMNLMK